MTDWSALLERAKWERVADSELAAVAAELQKEEPAGNRYTLLHILGKAGARSYRRLVESYLECRDEPMLARLALQILCSFWRENNRYVDQIVRFLRGEPWDETDEVRLIAISEAGEYLRDHSHAELLRLLLKAFGDEGDNPIARQAAYCALGRAVGRGWTDLPSAARQMDFARDVDQAIIMQARERLAQELVGTS